MWQSLRGKKIPKLGPDRSVPNILDINTGVKYCNDDSYLYFVHTNDTRGKEGGSDEVKHARGILAVGIINNIRTTVKRSNGWSVALARALRWSIQCAKCWFWYATQHEPKDEQSVARLVAAGLM